MPKPQKRKAVKTLQQQQPQPTKTQPRSEWRGEQGERAIKPEKLFTTRTPHVKKYE